MRYKISLNTSKWARYIDKKGISQASFIKKALEYLFNKLTPLYSKIYYKEENYLKVKTAVFKYITPPIIKFGMFSTLVYLVYKYISTLSMFNIYTII